MTMQVTKGEFDRRVKLLEQKVQESANKLLTDYKEFVERVNSITTDNADFNRYAAIVDRINSCFDTNGQFDGSHIAPLSIETSALSVGQRSQALNLKNVKFEVKEYVRQTTNPNEDNYNNYGVLSVTDENNGTSNNGLLTHYTLFNNEQGEAVGNAEFNITYSNIPLSNNTALHYIYAKLQCTKAPDGTYIYSKIDNNNPPAEIVVDINQKTIEGGNSFTGFLWILLGTISKEFSKDGNYYRIVDLNYGLTTINGRLITTGRIEGSDSDSAWFDLDKGEIGGKINFTASQSSLNNVVSKGYTKTLYKVGSASTPPTTNMPYLSQSTLYYNGWSESQQSTTLSNPYLYYCTISYIQTGDTKSNFSCSPAMLWVDGEWIYTTRTAYYLMQGSSSSSRPTPSSKPTSMPINSNTLNEWGFRFDKELNKLWSVKYVYTSEVTVRQKAESNTQEFVSATDYVFDEAASTSTYALSQTTTIDGGLILSSKIVCGGSGNESIAGMMGTESNYTFFSGNLNPALAPFWVNNSGKVYCSDLEVDNTNFNVNTNTYDFTNFKVYAARNTESTPTNFNYTNGYIYLSGYNNGTSTQIAPQDNYKDYDIFFKYELYLNSSDNNPITMWQYIKHGVYSTSNPCTFVHGSTAYQIRILKKVIVIKCDFNLTNKFSFRSNGMCYYYNYKLGSQVPNNGNANAYLYAHGIESTNSTPQKSVSCEMNIRKELDTNTTTYI